MKSFITTLILLGTVLALSIFNFIYVNHTADRMQSMIGSLPEDGVPSTLEMTMEIKDFWNKHKSPIGLTVPYATVDRVGEQAALLVAAAACGDVYGFHTARVLLTDAIEDVRRAEQFSIENLF